MTFPGKSILLISLIFLAFTGCDKGNDNIYDQPDNFSDYDSGSSGNDADNHKVDVDIEDSEDDDVFIPDSSDPDVIDEDFDEPFDDVPDPDGADDYNDQDIIDEDPDQDEIPVFCGNGIVEKGEDCDNGDFNSDEPGKIGVTCRTNCLYARCGDTIIDNPYEICDDGNSEDGDYCSSNCMTISGSCGDGKIQSNEGCDKASAGEGIGAYCSDDCLSIVGSCGDGTKQDNEKCDNAEFGDGIGPYYCSSDCQNIIGSCGDGTLQDNENCDDGDDNGKYGFCSVKCDGAGKRCGDGNKDDGYEQCDDGNSENDDYCSSDCQTVLGRCGDGAIQSNENCDNAIYGEGTGAYCSNDCQTVLGSCGDETVQDNEECDWGDENGKSFCEYGIQESCTVCNTACNFIAGQLTFCGDGKIDFQNGEVCDNAESDVGDGQGIGAYCSFDCKRVTGFCGDGAVQSHEVCDKATFYDGIGPEYCSDNCLSIIGGCGDGTLQSSMEECDNGSGNTDNCPYGQTSCTVCSTQCEEINGAVSICGDGRRDPDNEFCDSGSSNGEYKSDYPGNCNSDCQGIGAAGYCGDDVIQGAHEQCDNGEDNGAAECEYGTQNCDVCTTGCETVPATGKYCGDGLTTNGEKCDDGADNGLYGHCNSDCSGIYGSCGNGSVEGSEVCDDGENNGTYGYCNVTCTSVKECGDGTVQQEEVCDSGTDNGVYKLEAPGNCNADCQGVGDAGYCGNSIVESSNEECDHGGLITTDCEYGLTECTVCDSECKEQAGNVSYCGDGVTQTSEGETCDDGANNGNYGYCASDCKSMEPYCGDGTVNGTEDCDDGANNGLYGYCKSDCSGMGSYCGDGDITAGETCDDGTNNGSYGYCKSDCTGLGIRCGDEIIQTSEGETCDDGADNGSYGHCKSDCSGIGPHCGDGNTDGTETCDDGVNNGSYGYCKSDCSGMGPYCGDGNLSDGETCDDGSNNGSYGYCNSDCNGPGERCGDGLVQSSEGENCDDGTNNGSYGYCKSDCSGMGPYCGDGSVTDEESCDDGVNNGTYGYCKSDCSGVGPYCGDGTKNGDEICDDGHLNGTQGYCNSDCSGNYIWCGDGITNGDEDCDNGVDNGEYDCDYGEQSCKVCSSLCIELDGNTSYCGDSNLDDTNGEFCDDGANNGSYKAEYPGYCSSDCQSLGEGGYCGDNAKNEPYESCDYGEANNGILDCSYGQTSCDVCSYSCVLESGITSYCGDGEKNGPELCDDGADNGVYSINPPGNCNLDCLGYGDGGYCGDNVTTGSEQCDDGSNNGSPFFCDGDCTTSCGDGIVDYDEICDTNDVTCSNYAYFSSGTAECPSNCSFPDGSTCVDDPAYTSPLFKTSQTLCYNNSVSISCPSKGSGFYGQDPQFNFTSQSFYTGTDTIEEQVSGLFWEKDTPSSFAECASGTTCTLSEAELYCDNLELDGLTDWRLPTAFEFSTLFDYTSSGSMIDTAFTNNKAGSYWTSDGAVSNVDGTVTATAETSQMYVKCVSGSADQCLGTNRSTYLFDGNLIVDALSLPLNIVVFWYYDNSAAAMTWEESLQYCESLTINGYTNFRLPTVNELHSIVDRSVSPASIFFFMGSGTFWTSTTFNADPNNAYSVNFSSGNVSYSDKTGAASVICVK